jgi:hypothetical protein
MSSFYNNNNNTMVDDDKRKKHHMSTGWILFFVFLWVFLGVAAYVKAFQCTADDLMGGDARKIVMFLLAGLLGPFFWVIYFYVKSTSNYCKRK